MPLHGQSKALRALDPEGFDEPIRRARLDGQALTEPVDALGVERVDRYPIFAGQAVQQALRLEDYLMRRTVLHLEFELDVLAVIESAVDFVHLLMQRATEGNIHFLESATDPQHRNTGRHGLANERQRGRVPRWVVQGSGVAGRSRIVMRLTFEALPVNITPSRRASSSSIPNSSANAGINSG